MVTAPPGEFSMGSPVDEIGRVENEGPLHTVVIARQFEIAEIPITVAQFAAFADATGHATEGICHLWQTGGWTSSVASFRSPGFPQTGHHPAVCVSWEDARAYVGWLARETGQPYRMPTEAEWEYCARAGTATRYSWGEKFSADRANCRVEKSAAPLGMTVRADAFERNAWGLYQMHGNVWEWCEDRYTPSYDVPRNLGAGHGIESELRVVRGGGWNNGPNGVRSARRHAGRPDVRRSDLGFRVARTVI